MYQEVTELHTFDIVCHIYVYFQAFFTSVFLQCERQLQLPDTSAETTGQANRPVIDDQLWRALIEIPRYPHQFLRPEGCRSLK